ncbi:MAG: hypothetical protein M5U28_38605 [Sandaracinaceae bacterium]|nr:hypothetical protein [Sandaracinaceae bacterium]
MGSAAGAALALFSLAWVAPDPPFYLIVVRLLVGAATGAILGALLALVSGRLRRETRYQHPAGYRDFLVKVRTRDPATAENVRDLLSRAGATCCRPSTRARSSIRSSRSVAEAESERGSGRDHERFDPPQRRRPRAAVQ